VKRILLILGTFVPTILILFVSSVVFAKPADLTATVFGSGETFTITVEGGTGLEQIEAYTPNQLVFTPEWTLITTNTYQAVITSTTGWDSFTLFWKDQTWVDQHDPWENNGDGFMVRAQTPPAPQPNPITATVTGQGESFTITVEGGTGTEQLEVYRPDQYVFTPDWTLVTTGTYQAIITDTTGWDSFTLFWLDQTWVDQHSTWEDNGDGFMIRSPKQVFWSFLPFIRKD